LIIDWTIDDRIIDPNVIDASPSAPSAVEADREVRLVVLRL
jgi:hypothetical protein